MIPPVQFGYLIKTDRLSKSDEDLAYNADRVVNTAMNPETYRIYAKDKVGHRLGCSRLVVEHPMDESTGQKPVGHIWTNALPEFRYTELDLKDLGIPKANENNDHSELSALLNRSKKFHFLDNSLQTFPTLEKAKEAWTSLQQQTKREKAVILELPWLPYPLEGTQASIPITRIINTKLADGFYLLSSPTIAEQMQEAQRGQTKRLKDPYKTYLQLKAKATELPGDIIERWKTPAS